MTRLRRLRLLQGGRSPTRWPGGLEITVAGRERPPFPVEAVAIEDDTYLVLGADPAFREPTEHVLRVMTAAHAAQPVTPGTVVVRAGSPLRLHAVVHDLARSPTWTERWVRSALVAVFEGLASRRLRTLGLPPLGSRHGSLEIDRFLALLAAAVETVGPTPLRRIQLDVSGDEVERTVRWLARAAAR